MKVSRTKPQAGIPKRVVLRNAPQNYPPMEGVVTAVYYVDSVDRSAESQGIVVDVLTTFGPIKGAPVAQQGYAVENCAQWVPQPTTATAEGQELQLDSDTGKNTLPDEMDGDRVLIVFREGSWFKPVVVGALPHVRTQRVQNGAVGRDRPPVTPGVANPEPPLGPDGFERYTAHQGSVARISRFGDVEVDCARGGTTNTGQAMTGDRGGRVDLNVRRDQEIVIRMEGMPVFRVRSVGGVVNVDIGETAGEPAVLGDSFKTLFDAHVHTTFYGVTGPPSPDKTITANPQVLSTRVRLPTE